jgi:hypothetical protein
MDRERAGREGEPPGRRHRQPDGQGAAHARGSDANKNIVGRNSRSAVETDGRLLIVNLTTADTADCTDARASRMSSANAGRGLSICSPIAPMAAPGGSISRLSSTSSSKLCAASTVNQASKCYLRVSRRTHVRLANPIAPSRPRLRAAPRCLRGHDPRRHGKPPPAPHGPPVTILERMLTAAHNSQRAVCPVQGLTSMHQAACISGPCISEPSFRYGC